MAGNVSPCPVGTVPIQITTPSLMMTPSGSIRTMRFSTEIDGPPYFRAFVTAVTEHIAAWLGKDKLCVTSAESISRAGRENRSLLQFVHWRYVMSHDEYTVPVMIYASGRRSSSCRISSPWIDLIVERGAVPSIRGIVYWNERQLLADQAVLEGSRNVPPGRAIPLEPGEHARFRSEYWRSSAEKPIEARVPPDILWLFRGTLPEGEWSTLLPFRVLENRFMYEVIKESAEGYTKLVTTLIDRCLAANGAGVAFRYSSILDVADPVLLKQYKIDTPPPR
jgi:hypothetical protein